MPATYPTPPKNSINPDPIEGPLYFKTLEAARATALGGDIIPLDALAAPLVDKLQTQIRAQHKLIDQLTQACHYALNRTLRDEKFASVMIATETESNLTTALANSMLLPRAQIARHYHAFHRSTETYGCIDDPIENDQAA